MFYFRSLLLTFTVISFFYSKAVWAQVQEEEPIPLPLSVDIHDTSYLTGQVIPRLLPEVGQSLGLDVFNIEIPDVPNQTIFNEKYSFGGLGKCKVIVRVRADNLFASVGMGEEDIELVRVGNRRVVAALNLKAIAKGQIHVQLAGADLCDFLDSSASVDVEINNLVGHVEVHATTSEDGKLSLQPVDEGDDLNFEVVPDDLDIDVTRTTGIAGGILDLFEQIQILTGTAIEIMGENNVEALMEKLATQYLLDHGVQLQVRDSLFTAIEQGLSEPISFEHEEQVEQDFELEGHGFSIHSLVRGSVQLKEMGFIGENGVHTGWKINIETGEAHECAKGLQYQPSEASLRLPQLPSEIPDGLDASISIPNAAIGKAIFETAKQGALCSAPLLFPLQCELPDEVQTRVECFPSPLGGGQECIEIPIGVDDGLRYAIEEAPSFSLSPEGQIRLYQEEADPNTLKLSLPMKATLGDSDAGMAVSFLVQGGLHFVVEENGKVIFGLSPNFAIEVTSDLAEILEEMRCGNLDENMLNAWLRESIVELFLESGNRWSITPPLNFDTRWTEISLLPRELKVSPRGVFIPMHFGCVGGECEPASRTVYGCPNGFRFDAEVTVCRAEYSAQCQSGSYREDVSQRLSSSQFPGISFVEHNRDACFRQTGLLPSKFDERIGNAECSELPHATETQYQKRPGRDRCTATADPLVRRYESNLED